MLLCVPIVKLGFARNGGGHRVDDEIMVIVRIRQLDRDGFNARFV